MMHSFDIDVAKKIGLNEAIVLEVLKQWIGTSNDFAEWTEETKRKFREQIPYMRSVNIKQAINTLVFYGYVQIDNTEINVGRG